jgi:putative endonuclease
MPVHGPHVLCYILASDSHEFYIGVTNNLIGVTNNLARRVAPPRAAGKKGRYTAKHRTTRVYGETCADVRAAIRREKQIKGWTGQKKLQLVESMNPLWRDLAEGW